MKGFGYLWDLLWGIDRQQKKSADWLSSQLEVLQRGEDVCPPWVAFPSSEPMIGWRQGYPEHWFYLIWIPFWRSLQDLDKADYLDRWNAADDWKDYLLHVFK